MPSSSAAPGRDEQQVAPAVRRRAARRAPSMLAKPLLGSGGGAVIGRHHRCSLALHFLKHRRGRAPGGPGGGKRVESPRRIAGYQPHSRETTWRAATRISSRTPASKCRRFRSPTWPARRDAGDAPLVIDVREQGEWDEGHIPGLDPHPARLPREPHRGRRDARTRRSSSAARRATARCWPASRCSEMGYANVSSLAGRLPALEAERPGLRRARRRSPPTSARATAATSSSPRSARRASSSCSTRKALLIGAGGLGVAGGLLPGRGRRGHHRPGRRRRGGRQQPAAPDHPHHRPRGDAQGRVGAGSRSRR